MKNNKKTLLIGIIICTSFFVGFLIANSPVLREKPRYNDVLWPNPPNVSKFKLSDVNGEEILNSHLLGYWNIIFFGFTHCPDICPATLAKLKMAEDFLLKQNIFENSRVIFISVDTQRDNRALVKRYLKNFSNSFMGLVGDESEVKKLSDSLGAVYYRTQSKNSEIIIDHSSGLFFVSPRNELIGVLTQPFSSNDIIERYVKITDFYKRNIL